MGEIDSNLNLLFNDSRCLGQWLSCLAPDKFESIITLACNINSAFTKSTNPFTKNTSSLLTVLEELSDHQKSMLFEAVKSRLPDLLNTHSDLMKVAKLLTTSQIKEILRAKKNLSPIVSNHFELKCLIKYFDKNERQEILIILEKYLPNLIQGGGELALLVNLLTEDQSQWLCTLMQDKFLAAADNEENLLNEIKSALTHLELSQIKIFCSSLINAGCIQQIKSYSLVKIMEELPQNTIQEFFNCINPILTKIIKTDEDLLRLLEILTPNQCSQALKSLASSFPCINSIDIFNQIQRLLSDEQSKLICSMDESLTNIVQSLPDFNKIFKALDPSNADTKKHIFKTLIKLCPNIIKTSALFNQLMRGLSITLRSQVFDQIKSTLPSLIKSTDDLKNILSTLNPDQKKEVITLSEDSLSKMLKNPQDINKILIPFTPKAEHQTLKLVQSKLATIISMNADLDPKLIQNIDDFEQILLLFTPKQTIEIINSSNDYAKKLIRSATDFGKIMKSLANKPSISVEQDSSDLSKHTTTMINKQFKITPEMVLTNDIKDYLIKENLVTLPIMRQAALFNVLKDKLPQLIQRTDDLILILDHLTPCQQREILDLSIGSLATVIKPNEFKTLLSYFNQKKAHNISKHLQASLHHLIINSPNFGGQCISSLQDLQDILKPFTAHQQREIILSEKGFMTSVVKSIEDFEQLMTSLLPIEHPDIFDALTEQLLEMIKTESDFSRLLKYLRPEQIPVLCDFYNDQFPWNTSNFMTITIYGNESSAHYLARIINDLQPVQIIAFCQSLKDQRMKIIKTSTDIGTVMEKLDADQKQAFFSGIKDMLPHVRWTFETNSFFNEEQWELIEQIKSLIKALHEAVHGKNSSIDYFLSKIISQKGLKRCQDFVSAILREDKEQVLNQFNCIQLLRLKEEGIPQADDELSFIPEDLFMWRQTINGLLEAARQDHQTKSLRRIGFQPINNSTFGVSPAPSRTTSPPTSRPTSPQNTPRVESPSFE